jgi:hypothetical protein
MSVSVSVNRYTRFSTGEVTVVRWMHAHIGSQSSETGEVLTHICMYHHLQQNLSILYIIRYVDYAPKIHITVHMYSKRKWEKNDEKLQLMSLHYHSLRLVRATWRTWALASLVPEMSPPSVCTFIQVLFIICYFILFRL